MADERVKQTDDLVGYFSAHTSHAHEEGFADPDWSVKHPPSTAERVAEQYSGAKFIEDAWGYKPSPVEESYGKGKGEDADPRQPAEEPAWAGRLGLGCMVEPQGNKVVLAPDEPTKVTEGGIHLTDKSAEDKDPVARGTVVGVGPGGASDNYGWMHTNSVVLDGVYYYERKKALKVAVGKTVYHVVSVADLLARVI